MGLSEDINALPVAPVGGQVGINSNIGTLNRAAKAHEQELLAVDGKVDGKLDKATADNTYAPTSTSRGIVNAVDYGVSPAATGAANRTALQSAVDAAVAQGKDLYLPEKSPVGASVKIAGVVNVTGPVRIYGKGARSCTLEQASKPSPTFFVTGQDVRFDNFGFLGNGLNMTGLSNPANFQNYVGIKAVGSAHGLSVSDLFGKDIYCIVLVRDLVTDPLSVPTRMKRFRATNIEGSGVWAAIHGGPFDDAYLTGIRGQYQKAFSTDSVDTGQKPHLIYIGTNYIDQAPVSGIWNADWRSRGVKITDCQAWDNPNTGSAFALKHIDGLDVANLSARNCPGGLELYSIQDGRGAGVLSLDDTYPAAGEESTRAGTSYAYCRRVTIDGILISFKTMQHGRALFMESTSSDCVARNVEVVSRRVTDDLSVGNTEVVVSGSRNRVENFTARNLGAAASSAIRVVGTGDSGEVINPRTSGKYQYAINQEANHLGSFLDYDPALIRPSRSVSSSASIRTATGANPLRRDRSVGQVIPPGLVDKFDREDAIGLTATDDGKLWFVRDVNANAANFAIDGNAARYAGGSARAVVLADGGSANGTVTAIIDTLGSGDGGIVIRGTDAQNYIVLMYRQSAGVMRPQLLKRVAGASPVMIGIAPTDKLTANGSTLAIVMSGTNISVNLDGVEVIAPQVVTDFSTIPNHGLLGNSTGQDVKVASITFAPAL